MLEKKRLAFEIVKLLWDEKIAAEAQGSFESTFQKKEIPKDIKTIFVKEPSLKLLDLVFATREVPSRSEAKRLISQNAIEIESKIYTNPAKDIKIPQSGIVIRIGKRIFIKIKNK